MDKKEFLVSQSKDEALIKTSLELLKMGLKNCDKYYMESDIPFFEILKDFSKENENDPDIEYIFLDVEHKDYGIEYTVYTQRVHEHFNNLESALNLIQGLLDDKIVEVALVYEERMASFFATHTGNHEKNVSIINDNVDFVMQRIMSEICSKPDQGHIHEYFRPAYPYTLLYGYSKQPKWAQIYLVSHIIGKHPEVYVIK